MAEIVLSAAGAWIGNTVFHSPIAAQLGFAAGSLMARNFLSDNRVMPASSLSDLKVTGTAYGEIIPWCQGIVRIPGQIWWASDRRPIRHEESYETGGKGGGGGTSTYVWYTYDVDMLVGLTDNIANSLRRVWFNGKLGYNVSETAGGDDINNSLNTPRWDRMTFYGGESNQMPDAVYEAAVGLGNVPAYRGRSCVFFESMHLDQSGVIPNMMFEVNINIPTPLRLALTPPAVQIGVQNNWSNPSTIPTALSITPPSVSVDTRVDASPS